MSSSIVNDDDPSMDPLPVSRKAEPVVLPGAVVFAIELADNGSA
jgi:hypothetical protein